MANTIVITKTSEGVVLVNNDGDEYTLLSNYRVKKKDGKVEILTDLGGSIDKFDPVEVEKVVLADTTEVPIADLDTLFTQLHTNFFLFEKFGLIGPLENFEFISDANSLPGENGNYRLKMVGGKLQTQKLIADVWTVLEQI